VIHGVAGSGKTMILGYRAAWLAQALGQPILVLCFNVALAAKLRHVIADRGLSAKVSVYNFHAWCAEQLRLYHVDKPAPGEGFFERLVEQVVRGLDAGRIPRTQYGAVMIDEGHDFEPPRLKLIAQMVDPQSNSLLVLYDDAQSIYGKARRRKFSFASVGIDARGRTTILRLNYRNTAEVLAVAYEFARDILKPEEAEEDGIPMVAPETAGRGASSWTG
jgi:superfamily I DNA/RNA helicase